MYKNEISESELRDFLIEAKKQSYANSSAEKAMPSRVGSHDYHYETHLGARTAVYHDTYFGGLKFIGEEVVYIDSDEPVWGMNYYGETLDESVGEEMMDAILRPALMRVGEDKTVLPLRGPRNFSHGEYVYRFDVSGSLNNFEGVEEIYRGRVLIFRLRCCGGWIR